MTVEPGSGEHVPAGDPVDRFRRDFAAMPLPGSAQRRERLLLAAGAGGMATGLVLSLAGYALAHGTTPLLQQDALVLALVRVSVCVVGSTLFLRYAAGRLLRLWLTRLLLQHAAQTDRVVSAVLESSSQQLVREGEAAPGVGRGDRLYHFPGCLDQLDRSCNSAAPADSPLLRRSGPRR